MQVRSMRVCLIVLSIAILLCWSNMAVAHQYDQQDSVGKLGQGEAESSSVVTVRELTGPTKTEGIESVKALGIVDLGAEFPSLQGHQMRARIFTIKPGGTVARQAEGHARVRVRRASRRTGARWRRTPSQSHRSGTCRTG